MRKKLATFIFLIWLIDSSFAQIPIKVKQFKSFDRVIISYDSTEAYIWGVQIPFEFEACFNGNDSLWISQVFNYANGIYTESTWSSIPYKYKSKNGDQYIFPDYIPPQLHDTCYYRVLSRYYFNSDSWIQDSLVHYVKQMQSSSVTSLDVGTLSEFKTKHPKIVERILNNDSIRFTIRKAPREFIDFIAVPVEY